MNATLGKIANKDLLVARWNDGIESAHRTMSAARLRHLPVVDDSNAIVGILSDRDIQRAMHTNEGSDFIKRPQDPVFEPDATVADYMSWPVQMISESKSISDAAKMMVELKISSLIVTGSEHAVGIVTSEDLLRTLFESASSPKSLRENLRSFLYNSPVGTIAQDLANVGI